MKRLMVSEQSGGMDATVDHTSMWSAPMQQAGWRQSLGYVKTILLVFALIQAFYSRGREGGDYAQVDSGAAVRIGLILALMVGVFSCCRPSQFAVMMCGRSVAWFIGLHIFGMASALWSSNALYSGYFAFEVLVLTYATMVVICSSGSFYEAERMCLIWLLAIALFNVMRDSRFGASFSLASTHSVSTGCLGAVVACYSLAELSSRIIAPQRKRFLMGSCVLGCILLVIATSSGSNMAMLIGLATVVMVAEKPSIRIMSSFVSLMIVGSILAMDDLDSFQAIVFPNKSTQEIVTATGRTRLWVYYLELIMERPLLGWGFAILPRITPQQYSTSTHNSILGVAGGMGLAGLSLLVIWSVHHSWELLASARRGIFGAKGCTAGFFVILVNSLTNGAFGERASPSLWALFVLMGLSLSFPRIPSVNQRKPVLS